MRRCSVLESEVRAAARQALQAGAAIAARMADLTTFAGNGNCKVKIAVSIHACRAVVGEIGSSLSAGRGVMAVGEASTLRRAAQGPRPTASPMRSRNMSTRRRPGGDREDKVFCGSRGSAAPLSVFLSLGPVAASVPGTCPQAKPARRFAAALSG